MGNTVWVLTEEYNQYDQYGKYFRAVFKDKPTIEQLVSIGIAEWYASELLQTGGGRNPSRGYATEWLYLEEFEFGTSHFE